MQYFFLPLARPDAGPPTARKEARRCGNERALLRGRHRINRRSGAPILTPVPHVIDELRSFDTVLMLRCG